MEPQRFYGFFIFCWRPQKTPVPSMYRNWFLGTQGRFDCKNYRRVDSVVSMVWHFRQRKDCIQIRLTGLLSRLISTFPPLTWKHPNIWIFLLIVQLLFFKQSPVKTEENLEYLESWPKSDKIHIVSNSSPSFPVAGSKESAHPFELFLASYQRTNSGGTPPPKCPGQVDR